MAVFSEGEHRFVDALSRLAYANPFSPERINLEREALGGDFNDPSPVWSQQVGLADDRPNVRKLASRAEQLAKKIRKKLCGKVPATDSELALYQDLCYYVLYYCYWPKMNTMVEPALRDGATSPSGKVAWWKPYRADFAHYLELPARELPSRVEPDHLLACFFQIRQAFHHIFTFLVGGSMPAARLRAAVWQSIFTHDMRRYRRTLYRRMGTITTLVTGPSGTGKELVARAVGMSRYIPFDAKTETFSDGFCGAFHTLNLSALSPTLIESDLFGHRRGAYTGALEDRAGWLEKCQPLGTMFLDEIGELDAAIQVKLLRVLQNRTFQRIGESEDRHFHGKLIVATNRDLAAEMRAERFREDFYYRLCSDMITTPSLREQLADEYGNLRNLILFIARREIDDEAEALADEVLHWIDENLGCDYAWKGNIRELEQCVRNVMIRRDYRPTATASEEAGPQERLVTGMTAGTLTAEELLRQYCTLIYAKLESYEATAGQLGLDRRTVKSKIDRKLLVELKSPNGRKD